jgi:hypothetical protein
MASELKVDKFTGVTTAGSILVTGEGNSTTTNLQQGLAKSWVLGSDAAALTDSFNTASGTDNGVGDYTYTFTTAMSSANFTSHVTGMQNARRYGFSEARTTTTNRIDFRDDNELSADCANSCAIHGDLA